MKGALRRLVARVPFLMAFAVAARRLWRERSCLAEILTDLRKTRREAGFLRHANVPSNGRRVLILAIDDSNIYACKLFGLVASALRLRGWKPVVLLRNRGCWLGRHYFKAFGFETFVYLDDIELDADERDKCGSDAQTYLQGDLDLQRIKAWRYGEAWLGPHMIGTLSRVRFEGMPDFADEAVRSLLATVLPDSIEHVLRARKLLGRILPDLALGVEVNYSMFGSIVDACVAKGVGVVQLIQPWKDDALIFKRLTLKTRREHPASVDRSTLERLICGTWTERHDRELNQIFADRYNGKWFLQSRNQKNTSEVGRSELISMLELDPSKPIATVFSHVLWDANLFYGEDLFKDYGDWFVQTVRAACANEHLNWLIKIHPANVWKRAYEGVRQEYAELALLRKHVGALPRHVKLLPADTSVSTLSLFHGTDYGVTVRGTSGMELPCFGKPCLTAGTGRYSALGFTIDSQTAEEYRQRLTTLHQVPPMTQSEIERARWHAYIAFVLRPWTMKSANTQFCYRARGQHPLDHNLSLTVSTLDALQSNGDLIRCGEWLEGIDVDYVNSPDILEGGHA